MSEPYLSQISIFSFNFAPRGWAACNGQLLPINQNQALYSLLGTIYGGDGNTTFALPDLRGRIPTHLGSNFGNNYPQGSRSGTETITLLTSNMPAHTHTFAMTATGEDGDVASPGPGVHLAARAGAYSAEPADTTLSTPPIAQAGGQQPFSIMQPYLALNICMAIQGIFPSRN